MTTGLCKNTDRELWREDANDPTDLDNFYSPSIFVTLRGGIGINVGGCVIVMPVRRWHKIALEYDGT